MNGTSGVADNISPGIGGFLAFFLLACALWLLMRNMIGHLRKVDYREELDADTTDTHGIDGGIVSRPTSASASIPRERSTHDDPAPADPDETPPPRES